MSNAISNALRGNQNARKHPIALGALAASAATGLTAVGGATRAFLKQKKVYNSDLALSKRFKSATTAAKIKTGARTALKKATVAGAAAGARKVAPFAIGLGVGTASATASVNAYESRHKVKTLVKRGKQLLKG
jgi:hypothetical protein